MSFSGLPDDLKRYIFSFCSEEENLKTIRLLFSRARFLLGLVTTIEFRYHRSNFSTCGWNFLIFLPGLTSIDLSSGPLPPKLMIHESFCQPFLRLNLKFFGFPMVPGLSKTFIGMYRVYHKITEKSDCLEFRIGWILDYKGQKIVSKAKRCSGYSGELFTLTADIIYLIDVLKIRSFKIHLNFEADVYRKISVSKLPTHLQMSQYDYSEQVWREVSSSLISANIQKLSGAFYRNIDVPEGIFTNLTSCRAYFMDIRDLDRVVDKMPLVKVFRVDAAYDQESVDIIMEILTDFTHIDYIMIVLCDDDEEEPVLSKLRLLPSQIKSRILVEDYSCVRRSNDENIILNARCCGGVVGRWWWDEPQSDNKRLKLDTNDS